MLEDDEADHPIGSSGAAATVTSPAEGGDVPSIDLALPFSGRWLVRNSPANRFPSHGTTRFASAYAIDFVPVDDSGRTARFDVASIARPEPVENFPGYGRPIVAPLDGVVVATRDEDPDHRARRGLPSIGYALTQRRRASAGWQALAGNHVFIASEGVVVALCHLQRGTVIVRPGEHVTAGDLLARCGNSGNSTEPHLHIQAFDDPVVENARAVRLSFGGGLPRNGQIVEA